MKDNITLDQLIHLLADVTLTFRDKDGNPLGWNNDRNNFTDFDGNDLPDIASLEVLDTLGQLTVTLNV